MVYLFRLGGWIYFVLFYYRQNSDFSVKYYRIRNKKRALYIFDLPLRACKTAVFLYQKYGDKIYISLMSQYTPSPDLPAPLNRRVTTAEYDELVSYAEKLGIKNAFTQERESAKESYIPDFEE